MRTRLTSPTAQTRPRRRRRVDVRRSKSTNCSNYRGGPVYGWHNARHGRSSSLFRAQRQQEEKEKQKKQKQQTPITEKPLDPAIKAELDAQQQRSQVRRSSQSPRFQHDALVDPAGGAHHELPHDARGEESQREQYLGEGALQDRLRPTLPPPQCHRAEGGKSFYERFHVGE